MRDVINNEDGFESLYPKYSGLRRSPSHSASRSRSPPCPGPKDHGLPFSTWSLTKLAEFVVAEEVVDV
ncbi:MAG TPA: hypothetical protein VK988_20770 [Acidimicrobiales bacterium]|nr:hypothetical protein [Acidimicrobiales bacterium]